MTDETEYIATGHLICHECGHTKGNHDLMFSQCDHGTESHWGWCNGCYICELADTS